MKHTFQTTIKYKKKYRVKYSIIFIDFLIFKLKNHLLALYFMSRLEKSNDLNFLELFDLYLLKKQLKKTFNTMGLEKFDDRQLEEFLYFDNTFKMLKKVFMQMLRELQKFWNEFSSKKNFQIWQNLKRIINIIKKKDICKKIISNLSRYSKEFDELYIFS